MRVGPIKLASMLWPVAPLLAAPVWAQTSVRQEPAIGEMKTAPVGSTIWEEYRFEGTTGVIIDAPVRANWGTVEVVDLPAGSALHILREKKLKACRTYTMLPNLGVNLWSDCLFDLDNDGRFEKVSYNSSGASKAVDPPVPYRRGLIEIVGDRSPPNSKKILIYLGGDATTLKLSYREFSNKMARPAFTEDLSIPLVTTFPQAVAVKDRIITIHGISGMGLSYQLTK